MKYVVKLTYTNPAHEHVTLRRRVDTVNRIVEAASEQEALNRAANQQRALGFKIQEATIVEQEKASVKTEQLTEASKEGSAVMRGMRATLKSMDLRHGVDSDKREAGYKMSPAVKAAQAKSDVLSKVVKRPQAGTLAAVHKSMEREMTRNMKEEVEYIEEKLTAADPASKWISDFVKSDNPKFAGKSKKERINQALGAYYAAKRGNVEEGYDPSSAEIAKMLVKKHGAGNVTKQHILDMEADRDSRKALDHDEIMKHVEKMTEEVEQVDEGVATAQKVMDRANVVAKTNPDPKKRFAAGGLANKAMMRTINPTGVNTGITRGGGNKAYRKITGKAPPHQLTKKTGVSEEVVAEANTRVVNKEVKKEKAAETAVAAARRAKNTKNKVETEPRLDMDVGSSEKKYVTKV